MMVHRKTKQSMEINAGTGMLTVLAIRLVILVTKLMYERPP